MILCFEEDSIRDIYEVILANFINLSCNTNGLCVIKKIISCTKSHTTITKILHILIENQTFLLQNQHGNYSLQMAIECWDLEYSLPIMQTLYGQFYNLSLLKFSSNVVEKCLEKGDEATNSKFMEEICQKSKVMGN
jgi:pumilio RNA-binding family